MGWPGLNKSCHQAIQDGLQVGPRLFRPGNTKSRKTGSPKIEKTGPTRVHLGAGRPTRTPTVADFDAWRKSESNRIESGKIGPGRRARQTNAGITRGHTFQGEKTGNRRRLGQQSWRTNLDKGVFNIGETGNCPTAHWLTAAWGAAIINACFLGERARKKKKKGAFGPDQLFGPPRPAWQKTGFQPQGARRARKSRAKGCFHGSTRFSPRLHFGGPRWVMGRMFRRKCSDFQKFFIPQKIRFRAPWQGPEKVEKEKSKCAGGNRCLPGGSDESGIC